MAKVSIEEIQSILEQNKIEQPKIATIIKDLEQVVEELKEEREANKLPTAKYESVIILLDKTGELKDKELVGWVVKQVKDGDAGTILSRLCDAAKVQNENTKKKKNIIASMTELFEHIKPKFLKEKELKNSTKEPTRVLVTSDKMI